MTRSSGKYLKSSPGGWHMPLLTLPVSFFLIEVFAFFFLSTVDAAAGDLYAENFFEQQGYTDQDLKETNFWPLIFGAAWAALLTGLLRILPGNLSRAAYGITYFLFLGYAIVQTGYFLLFREMMWISDFHYASEGSDYFNILLSYPLSWWLSLLGLLFLGGVTVWKYPVPGAKWLWRVLAVIPVLIGSLSAMLLPNAVFLYDKQVQYAASDYGRSQSAEAAYENMFNAHRLYQVCGIYQTAVKDIYTNYLFPLTPDYRAAQEAARAQIDAYFAQRGDSGSNSMTGLLKDKDVILVLMESMDDWMIGEHTPTLEKMMGEGITFTQFYTPGYGGIRTFNTEFSINTGSFLRSGGGYAFDYVTNSFDQSLASLLKKDGYRCLTYHYNDPSFYSRGVFSPAMGYEEYICYADYVPEKSKVLYDDQLLFDNQVLAESFFAEGKKLNFVITRSAHLSYKYNEVLSFWGLKKYPEYKGLTGNEETDCALLKARLVDDFFARLLTELEQRGQLEDTVIVGVTDHYTYGYKDTASLMRLSGVTDSLLLEKTPCFIWGPGVPQMEVSKALNTSDLLPTLLNLLGTDSPYPYIGQDAFDESYEGFVPFSDGSWISGGTAYDAGKKSLIPLNSQSPAPTPQFREAMAKRVQDFIKINNLILETDYYRSPDE